jgi:hypothetical protein
MKKVIITLLFAVTFSISAKAQDTKKSTQAETKTEVCCAEHKNASKEEIAKCKAKSASCATDEKAKSKTAPKSCKADGSCCAGSKTAPKKS